MTENQEAQEDELLALASIYGEDFQRESGAGAEVRVYVELPLDFKVSVKTGETYREYAVSSLPPLVLNFNLPVNYPSDAAPVFRLSCAWLSAGQLAAVDQHLEDIWREGQGNVVLFSWIQFLKEDLLGFVHIHSQLEVGRATPHHDRTPEEENEGGTKEVESAMVLTSWEERPSADLLPKILEHDEARRRKAFDGQVFACGICFSEKLGSDCLRFCDCGHVHCRTCLSQFFTVSIRDGRVQELRCPEPGCSISVTPSQVRQLVSSDLFMRYDQLLLQAGLDRMTDIVYCPRQLCASPAVLEPDGKTAICPACSFPFCSLCQKAYHGASSCKPDEEMDEQASMADVPMKKEALQALWEDYQSGSAERKKVLDKRYGKHVFHMTISDFLSQTWVEENSKQCPNCARPIKKEGGCRLMCCSICGQDFCWDCLTLLSCGNLRCLC